MIVTVSIKPFTKGRDAAHHVVVEAALSPDGKPQEVRTLTARAPRFAPDGVERPISTCLEEAFAAVLKQALA